MDNPIFEPGDDVIDSCGERHNVIVQLNECQVIVNTPGYSSRWIHPAKLRLVKSAPTDYASDAEAQAAADDWLEFGDLP